MRAPALLALLAVFPACRSGGPIYAQILPDPVPLDPRTGRAHFLLLVESRAGHRIRLGPDGPWLEPGRACMIRADLEPGESELLLPLEAEGRSLEPLVIAIRTTPTSLAEEAAFPLPQLGDWPARVTAGFHAPNHREPGRRLALDLVPAVPEGEAIFGTEVRSPFVARVLAVTSDAPDQPGGRPNELILQDREGRIWRLSHFARGSVRWRPDERIGRGEVLGRIGLSGETTGPHLHMELLGTK